MLVANDLGFAENDRLKGRSGMGLYLFEQQQKPLV